MQLPGVAALCGNLVELYKRATPRGKSAIQHTVITANPWFLQKGLGPCVIALRVNRGTMRSFMVADRSSSANLETHKAVLAHYETIRAAAEQIFANPTPEAQKKHSEILKQLLADYFDIYGVSKDVQEFHLERVTKRKIAREKENEKSK